MDLPNSMYDYRPERESEKDIVDVCDWCEMPIYHDDDYIYCNDAIFHDQCADEYNDEEEEDFED